jgi:hypothetical protein
MIRAIKLKTGEEMITSIEGINKVGEKETMEETLTFSKPFSIHLVPSGEGIGIQLLPWALYAKNHDSIPYPSSEVSLCVEPSTDIRNQYAQMTGLPTIPDDKIIVPGGGPQLSL